MKRTTNYANPKHSDIAPIKRQPLAISRRAPVVSAGSATLLVLLILQMISDKIPAEVVMTLMRACGHTRRTLENPEGV